MLGSSWSGVPDPGNPQAEPYNLYRYTSKRWDPATGDYDMGFRDYNPTLNRFLSRDSYNGALADLNLGVNPWTGNRYAFTAGNPTSYIERDGHDIVSEAGGYDYELAYYLEDHPEDESTLLYLLAAEGDDVENAVKAYYYSGTALEMPQDEPGVLDQAAEIAISATNPIASAADTYTSCASGNPVECAAGFIPGRNPLGLLKHADQATQLFQDAADRMARLVGRACSFDADTHVVMADGSTKPISEIQVGDKVLATDPETGEQAAKEVTYVWVHDDTVIDLVVDGEVITTTEDHPFWSVTDERFEQADELAAGELVLGADGEVIEVSGLKIGSQRQALAYNLTVAGIHTYHVGKSEVLVHNVCPLKPVNLPAWKKVSIDMEHISSGHMVGGSRVSPSKDLFPDSMTAAHVESTVRQAYRYSSRIATQGDRVLVRGSANGLTIEMWVNRQTRTIETAYPVSGP